MAVRLVGDEDFGSNHCSIHFYIWVRLCFRRRLLGSLVDWGVDKKPFLSSFRFLLSRLVLLALCLFPPTFVNSWSWFLLSTTAMRNPWGRLVLSAWRAVPRGIHCVLSTEVTPATYWLQDCAKFSFWEGLLYHGSSLSSQQEQGAVGAQYEDSRRQAGSI